MDKGFSSMELSSSFLGRHGKRVQQYGTIIIIIKGDMGEGLSSMNLSPPSPGEMRKGYSSMELSSSSSLFGEMLEKNSVVWKNKYTL